MQWRNRPSRLVYINQSVGCCFVDSGLRGPGYLTSRIRQRHPRATRKARARARAKATQRRTTTPHTTTTLTPSPSLHQYHRCRRRRREVLSTPLSRTSDRERCSADVAGRRRLFAGCADLRRGAIFRPRQPFISTQHPPPPPPPSLTPRPRPTTLARTAWQTTMASHGESPSRSDERRASCRRTGRPT